MCRGHGRGAVSPSLSYFLSMNPSHGLFQTARCKDEQTNTDFRMFTHIFDCFAVNVITLHGCCVTGQTVYGAGQTGCIDPAVTTPRHSEIRKCKYHSSLQTLQLCVVLIGPAVYLSLHTRAFSQVIQNFKLWEQTQTWETSCPCGFCEDVHRCSHTSHSTSRRGVMTGSLSLRRELIAGDDHFRVCVHRWYPARERQASR